MITALIRTHPGREWSTMLAVNSAKAEGCEIQIYYGQLTPNYEFNLYCNELKERVTDGYFFFLDSDDFVIPGAVKLITPHLNESSALICQMLRNGIPKPSVSEIIRGKIGLPCMVLHHSHKNIADIKDNEHGDYYWIKEVTDKIPWEFVNIPLVNAGKRSRGK